MVMVLVGFLAVAQVKIFKARGEWLAEGVRPRHNGWGGSRGVGRGHAATAL